MTLLHVYFALRNQQAFQRLLERDARAGGAEGTSAGRSWTRRSVAAALAVNGCDHLGRTVLHLACASTEPASAEYVRMLLAHPSTNVNLVDKENHWTALHRAMYAGNIEAAIILLKRTDTDTSIKDLEGYTAFDLYNATVQSASPTSLDDGSADLLTWGTNRNAALGLGDANDRTHPDHVVLSKDAHLQDRFRPVKVRDVRMSKLHTVILTDEPCDNVRLCGFGSGGRLGPFPYTLYAPAPLPISSHSIVSVALGQDHTLALTSTGEVMSWGLNRFAQLGYVVDAGQGGSADEFIQTTPRKINHLKKEFLKGVAACKIASACWSDSDVWTWGTNGGHLGYSKTATPVQVLPRKVSIIIHPIRDIAMSETAMVCLFMSGEVVCVWSGGVTKISFPGPFPSDISTVYRPPQAVRGPAVTKIVCCDDVFATLSANGEVFTFSTPTAGEGEVTPQTGARGQVKPQRLWALRRQFSSVRDVDIGADGAVIICTQSGHVYVRSRNLKSGTTTGGAKAFKFYRVAHAQRIVSVCVNSTGAFGALRVDYKPPPISVTGKHFAADMAMIAPYASDTISVDQDLNLALTPDIDFDDDLEDSSILGDMGNVAKLMTILRSGLSQMGSPTINSRHGADLVLHTDPGLEVPAHRVVLATRCVPLRDVLATGGILSDETSNISITSTPQQHSSPSSESPVLRFTGITILSLFILLHYLYADEVLAVWDRRIGSFFETQLSQLGLSITRIKADLGALARLLCLPYLTSALQFVGKHATKPSASVDFQWLFNQAQEQSLPRRNARQDPLAPDVALHLADRIVYTHSTVLRSRSEFFAAFFDDPDWTTSREDSSGVIDVQMGHFRWRAMQFVLAFICFGEEASFETLEFLHTTDELLEFMFLVISAANELLLNRLVLICSCIVLRHLNTYNACYLLTEAIHFNAVDLADRVQRYISANMEMLLESRILDDLDTRVVRKISEHTQREQAADSPISRGGKLERAALEKHKEWLALQDIPAPFVPTQKAWSGKDSPRMSPPGSTKKGSLVGPQLRLFSPSASPVLRPSLPSHPPPEDDIFTTDDTDAESNFNTNTVQTSSVGREASFSAAIPGLHTKPGWKKNPAMPRTDLKAIMAEAENSKRPIHARTLEGRGPSPGATAGSSQQQGLTPERWQSKTPPIIPRRIPSDLAMTAKPETPVRTAPSRTNVTSRTPQSMTPTSSSPLRPTMGPIITPMRQLSGPGSIGRGGTRKPSLGGAWTLPPVQPIAAPTVPGPTTTLPFAEIQRLQEMQGTKSAGKVKQSLRDIQEEERARQQEADFLRWWAAEEERVQREMSGQPQIALAGPGPSNQQSNKLRNKNKAGRDGKSRSRKGKTIEQRESPGH